MRIGTIEGHTRTLGEAQGYHALPLRDITINDTVTGPGTPAMETAWEPTPEEITALVLGAPIILRVVGTGHPPVMIDVSPIAERDIHLDDLSVMQFARGMMIKLARKRMQGYGGWEDFARCSAAYLSSLLRIAVEKGDPLDVGNFAMMLQQRGEPIQAGSKDPREQAAFARAVNAAKRKCPDCKGEGSEADYVGLDMRAVAVSCSACAGTGEVKSSADELIAEMLAVLKDFVTETRAYSSPECDECEIVGPILRAADAVIAKAEASNNG